MRIFAETYKTERQIEFSISDLSRPSEMESRSSHALVAIFVLFSVFLFDKCQSSAEGIDIPVNVERVLDDATRILDITPRSKFNISDLQNLVANLGQNKPPKHCGDRVRKEVRMMSRDEWKTYTDAINSLKSKGIYDKVAAIHRGWDNRLISAHRGPNFLGWHRIYLLFYEDLLRNENPCITIPYWDSSLDYAMPDPTLSVVWSEDFFGNGMYDVQIGPFANWTTGLNDPLVRNAGAWGSLIPRSGITLVLNKTKHSEIIDGRDPLHCIESYHNSVHVWVNGQMSDVEEAAEDPVFFMHHAFIDCFWELFQEKNGLEDAFKDYPDYNPNQDNDMHEPKRRMDPFADLKPFKGIKNRDGYRGKYNKMTKCAPRPTCSDSNTDCGSPYLTCVKGICVSKKAENLPVISPTDDWRIMRQGIQFVADIIDPRTRGDSLKHLRPAIDHQMVFANMAEST